METSGDQGLPLGIATAWGSDTPEFEIQKDRVVLRAARPYELPLEELIVALSAGGHIQFDLTLRIRVAGNPEDIAITGLSGTGVLVQSPLQHLLNEGTPWSKAEAKLVNADIHPPDRSTIVKFGEIEIDFRKMELRRCDQKIDVTAHEFKTLQYLVTRPEEAISRDDLLNHVWGYQNYPTTRTVDNRILKLRQKLERNPSKPVHLLTVRGVGYKFVP
jgi:hypothetical protein